MLIIVVTIHNKRQ